MKASSSFDLPVPRYAPDVPFPPYAFIPGRFPHPTRDPEGHRFGIKPTPCACPDPQIWRACPLYLSGIDLFNHGYYWEAHEAWETLWHACGRTGPTADFLRALIRFAAAGFKAREQRPVGVQRHVAAAAVLFQSVAEALGGNDPRYMGLQLSELCELAAAIAQGRHTREVMLGLRVEAVFDFCLRPQ